jgi:ABC-2 type transport system ATP-binding protein
MSLPPPAGLPYGYTMAVAPGHAAVEIVALVKHFGAKAAVDGLSLAVPRGSFFGLVGPNGAGKTTTLRMLTGLLRPDAGVVRVEGIDVWPDPAAVKARLGVVPDGLLLFERLTGAEMLLYAGMLRGLTQTEAMARVDGLLDVLGLRADADQLLVDYSHGMRKKTALGAALIHRPPVLVLDEPFEGIDPVSAVNIRTVLERYTTSGGTVIFSSHVMDLVERMCDHVAVIAAGRIAASGPLDQVRAGRRLEETFIHLVGASSVGTGGLDWLDQRSGP